MVRLDRSRSLPIALFSIGAFSQYIGTSMAVKLYGELPPLTLAWTRSLVAGTIILAVTRPRVWTWEAARLRNTAVFGLLLVSLNASFYLALDRLPLGTAVAIEFIGPVAVGLAGARSARNLAALGLGTGGVLLLAGVEIEANPAGLAWILVAAGCWAGYVLWGKRVAEAGTGADGLGVAMGLGALAYAPVAAPGAGPLLHDARLAALVVVIAVAASAVPYGLEQVILRRVDRTQFAILLAILPAAATVVGSVMLAQTPTVVEVLGIALVIGAVLIRQPAAERSPETPAIDPTPA